MRSRFIIVVAVLLAAVAVAFSIIQVASSPSRSSIARRALPSDPASYLGVYEHGPPHSYQRVAEFTRAVGRQPNLVGYYSGWGEAFQIAFARKVRMNGAVTILQWDPTGASLREIVRGRYDGYLRSFADSVRAFRYPIVMGFGHEMNARWYSWGYGHVRASTFVAAWRHIVELFRRRGADNVTWLWTINVDLRGTGRIASWWPGANYATWVGIDGYYYRPPDTFSSVFGKTIAEVRALTSKPVLISETAVGPVVGQPTKIVGLFRGMRQYQLLGLVWFDIAQDNGLYHQDWHIEDRSAAVAAFRRSASTLKLALFLTSQHRS